MYNAKNQIFGEISPNDQRIFQEYVIVKSKLLKTVKSEVTFPGEGSFNAKNITGIRVTDQVPKGKGYATLSNGGPGMTFVTVNFKSSRGGKIDSILEIYAKN